MGRLIRVLWLCVAWLIAILSGASFFYGIENGLRELSFLSAGLALAALAASVVPLSRGFDSSFGLEPRREPTLSSPVASTSGSAALTSLDRRTEWARTEADTPPVLHQTGPPVGEAQRCIHCGKVLADPSRGSRAWASSVWVVEIDGALRSIDPVSAKVMEAQPCTSLPTMPEAWGAS